MIYLLKLIYLGFSWTLNDAALFNLNSHLLFYEFIFYLQEL